jgi:hypothetical protein
MKAMWFVAAALLLTVACGDDSDGGPTPTIDVPLACGRIADAACAKLAECRALIEGRQMTAALCAQVRPAQVEACKVEAAHTTATQVDVDTCVTGFLGFGCGDLCGKVPRDPVACEALSSEPNNNVITCAP